MTRAGYFFLMTFFKYHGLGNDYLVFFGGEALLTKERIRRICDRHFGVGADGILWGLLKNSNDIKEGFKLRIFNPDGSEAEKSGNGLRIFLRYLYDKGFVRAGESVTVETLGGGVTGSVFDDGHRVAVQMGKVSFLKENEQIEIKGRCYPFYAVTIGNPHCVLPMETVSAELAKDLGPLIETHLKFPEKTNVQFLQIIDEKNIKIEIWERGAGYTLASGSSSSAAAAVAKKMGACNDAITVNMPGGALNIQISSAYDILMEGPVAFVAKVEMSEEIFH